MKVKSFLLRTKRQKRKERLLSGDENWIKYYEEIDDRNIANSLKPYSKLPINPNLILFESFYGSRADGNPRAIFEEIICNPEYAGYTLVWSVREPKKYGELTKKGAKVIKKAGKAYYETISTAKYIINDVINNERVPKKEGQIYIQTWHGTPLKRIGMDVINDGDALRNKEQIQERYKNEGQKSDFFLAQSQYAADKYATAFGLKDEEKNKIITCGYPQNASLFASKAYDKELLRARYKVPEGKKVILYCPTPRFNSYEPGRGYVFDINIDLEKLFNAFSEEAVVIVRMHYNHKNTVLPSAAYKGFLMNCSKTPDINALLCVSDMLITDYSSVMFDYANLRRPMIFYMPDRQEYEEQQEGLYFSEDKLPGMVCYNEEELFNAISANLQNEFIPDEKYENFAKKFAPMDNGQSAAEVVKKLIPPKEEAEEMPAELESFYGAKESKAQKAARKKEIKNSKLLKALGIPFTPFVRFKNHIKRFFKNKEYLKTAVYTHYYKHTRIQKKTVLYESYFGRGLLCGPYAIFLAALEDERLAGYKHIWVIDGAEEVKKLRKEYAKNPSVGFVDKRSSAYMKWLCKAEYLINNVSFPHYYTKKPGQVYVNTWHGIPLKNLGFDTPNGATETTNVLRNMLHTDYMVSASPFLTKVYEQSYKLDGLYRGGIIEEGYPRLDTLVRFDRETVLNKLRSFGVGVDSKKKIILYAPTWKGVNYAHANADVSGFYKFKEIIEANIDTNEYQLLIKPHQRVYQLAAKDMQDDFFVPAGMEANEVLSVVDILISDFSSIFYDYLYTGKPVLFYIENVEEYNRQQGTYYTVDEALPGPHVDTPEKLAELICNIDKVKEEWAPKYNEIRHYANADVKPGISRRIIDIVFFGKEKEYSVKRLENKKQKLMICRGTMDVNGITGALLSLLDNIDYDRFDVTLFIQRCPADKKSGLIKRINPNVRIIYKTWLQNMTVWELFWRACISNSKHANQFTDAIGREWKRTFGDAQFDRVVDYCGFSYMKAVFCGYNSGAKRYIWQHNDIMAEYKSRFHWMPRIMRLYKYYDGVVSCGKATMDTNYENIPPEYKTQERLTFAANAINYKRVLELSEEPVSVYIDPNAISFVTIGRKSPEKNQENLVTAFKRFHDENPDSQLFILGDGKLKNQLDRQITELKLWDAVYAPGNVANPYSILKKCSCFILPSLYEGLPIVVLEARVLHKPVIMGEFKSAYESCVENGQLMCGHEADDIYEAMVAFKEGKVSGDYVFDPEAYNRERINEFYRAIEV